MRFTAALSVILGLGVVLGWALGAAAADDAAPAPEHPAWEDVPVVKLWAAVEAGDAEASGSRPRSYRQVQLQVKNRSKKRVVIDLGGSHLRPKRRGSCQRLGLGPPVVADATTSRGPGTACLELEPGEERSLLMNTCCLDAGRSAPSNHRFVAVPEELPAVREHVLRWWIAHPDAPQGAVNSAIWSNRDRVILGSEAPTPRRMEKQRLAASYGGVSYQLKDEELTSLDAEGVRRVLGSQIWNVFPTDGAVYAVMPGEDLRPDLWRLAPTGDDPWGFVTDLDDDDELLHVVPAGGGNLALLYAGRVDWFDHASSETRKLISLKTDRFLSARVGNRTGNIYVTVHDPRANGVTRGGAIEGQSAGRFEVWVIDVKRGKAEMSERAWNVSAIRAGGAGIYGLSHKGNIRRFARGKFKDLGPVDAYRSIVAVGREKVWLLDGSDRLVAVHPGNGRPLFTSDANVTKEMWFAVDPVTDDLAYATGDGFFVIRAADGSVEKLPEFEEAEPGEEADED